MNYYVYKSIGETTPSKLDNIFYSSFMKEYYILACKMIVENGKYHFEGKDEEIIKKLEKLLKIGTKDHLPMEIAGSFVDDEGVETLWDGSEDVHFDHPDFQTALGEAAMAYGYTVSPKDFDFLFVKVNSIADVSRIKREYEEKNGLQEAA